VLIRSVSVGLGGCRRSGWRGTRQHRTHRHRYRLARQTTRPHQALADFFADFLAAAFFAPAFFATDFFGAGLATLFVMRSSGAIQNL
jgi:hypothetical protein